MYMELDLKNINAVLYAKVWRVANFRLKLYPHPLDDFEKYHYTRQRLITF